MSNSRNRRRKDQRASGPSRQPARQSRPGARPGASAQGPWFTRRPLPEGAGLPDPRAEWVWQGVLSLLAAAIYATTFSTHVALGDAPESVAGVRTLGILHAPGYPVYVLLAHIFGVLVPLGSWAFRVNLFSLVCAALTIGVVYRLTRHFGASRVGAAVGALGLATAASFWFNADFAKYYALTSLILAAAALAALLWEERGSTTALVVSGALLGLSVGSGWQLAAIVTLGVVLLVAFGSRRPTLSAMVGGVGALVATSVLGLVFLVVRAIQDPTLNWGAATNPSRLVGLMSRHDFSGAVSGKPGAVGVRVATLLGGLERDFGALVVLLLVCGCLELYRRRAGAGRVAFLAVVAGLNFIAVAIGSGVAQMWGFENVVVAGGYLLATMIVVAVVAGVGTTGAIEFVERAFVNRSGDARPGTARRLALLLDLVLVFAVVVPSFIVHRGPANLRVTPLADRYGSRVLEELPHNAVLLVWGEEYSMPMLYRQLVDHERSDVTIVSANSIGLAWARDQLTKHLHLGNALDADRADLQVEAMIAKLREIRPVYLDVTAMHVLAPFVAYRTDGYVAQVVSGKVGPHSVRNLDALAAEVKQSDTVDGLAHGAYRRQVYKTVYAFHERAHIELAKGYALQHDASAAVEEIRLANAINPVDSATLAKLAKLSAHDAEALILTL